MLVGKTGATRGPLLFNWHGTGGDGKRALDAIPASIRADIEARGGIIIAPTDNRKKRVGPSPNGVWFEESDLDYADHLVACAVKNHNIDPRQIYVTGCSAGGLMAAAMATKRSSYVAAAYPNSGGLVWGGKWQDKTRIPAVLTMHGGAGDTVVVNFQKTSERFLNLVKEAGGFGADCNHNIGHCKAPPRS
jgi:poly(3-hydroxybutyrate) depolymerase